MCPGFGGVAIIRVRATFASASAEQDGHRRMGLLGSLPTIGSDEHLPTNRSLG
jgi:hypothetical protein